MKANATHLSVLLDRSGSMEQIRADVIGGFNAFLAEQQRTEGSATLSLVQFDTVNPYEGIHSFVPVKDVPPLTPSTFVPRGGTPLLDAIGQGIQELEARLIATPPAHRPESVVVVIVTDGEENSSRRFSLERVRAMIAEKQELVGWKFLYLSASIAAVDQAVADYGLAAHRAMAFDATPQGSRDAFASVSANVSAMRRHEASDVGFRDEDRARHAAEQKRRRR